MSTASPDVTGVDLTRLLGLSPSSPRLTSILSSLVPPSSTSSSLPTPQLKSYPDIVYLNYHSLGLSISFEPTTQSYKPRYNLTRLEELELDKLSCTGIDIYNHEATSTDPDPSSKPKPSSSPRLKPEYSSFPSYPLLLPSPSITSTFFPLTPTTTGKDLVSVYGEPTRKGGGDTKGLGIWTEWLSEGIMVEWASGGLGAWEKGGESTWKVVSLFEGGRAKGKEENE